MKIIGNSGVYNPYEKSVNNTSKDKSLNTNNKTIKDKVEISPQALNQKVKSSEVDYLKGRINEIEDRDAKIAELKAQIANGTYKVSSEDLADAILESKRV